LAATTAATDVDAR